MGVLSVTEDDDFLERIGDKYEVCVLMHSSIQKPILPPDFANISSARSFINKTRRAQAVRLAEWVESQYIIGSLEETAYRIAANVLVSMTTCCSKSKDGSVEDYTFKYFDIINVAGHSIPMVYVCRSNGVGVIEIQFMEKNS